MRMTAEQKAAARAAILGAAGKRFREKGEAGIGIDGLAAAAGLTSGAIYAHFKSKAELFAGVVDQGLRRLVAGIERFKPMGPGFAKAFASRYLGADHRAAIAEGCLLPALSADIARSPADVRARYAEGVEAAIAALAQGCTGATEEERRSQAIAVLALSAGGLLIARALPDGPLADEVLASTTKGALRLLD